MTHIRKSADMLRPQIIHDANAREYVVMSRTPMFGHHGKARELARFKVKYEAVEFLKKVLEEDAKLTGKELLY